MKPECQFIFFSKDRACQLELLFRSLSDNFFGFRFTESFVLWKATNDEYKKAYNILFEEYGNFNLKWKEEKNFKEDYKEILSKIETPYLINEVDDNYYLRRTNLKPYLPFFTDDVCCISFRLGEKHNYCYTQNREMKIPNFERIANGHVLKWRWNECSSLIDWGYPHSINSHVYRTESFRNMINSLNTINNPNQLESTINHKRDMTKRYMICGVHQHVISVANNITQTGKNRAGKNEQYSLKGLNDKYLNGERISTKNLYNREFNSAHCELEYEFIK